MRRCEEEGRIADERRWGMKGREDVNMKGEKDGQAATAALLLVGVGTHLVGSKDRRPCATASLAATKEPAVCLSCLVCREKKDVREHQH